MSEETESRTDKDTTSVTSRSDEDDDLHLSLFPSWAHFEVAEPPRLKNGIEVHSGNKVRCSISGRAVWVTLDSGLSETVLSESLALILGLLKGDENTVKVKVTSVAGTENFDAVKLNPIVLTFENGQQLNDEALVLHDTATLLNDASPLVLGLPVLRRARMLQTFHREGSSTLYIHSSKRLLAPGWFPRRTRTGVAVFLVLQRRPRRRVKTVLVSTGVYRFCCSSAIEQKVRRKSGTKRAPLRATLDLGGKHILKGIQLKVLPHAHYDFVMGRQLLHELEATVNYKHKEILIPRGAFVTRVLFVHRRR